MTKTVKLISPIDGSAYLERTCLTHDAAFEVAARGRAAQPAWAARPLEERIALVLKAVEITGRTTDRMAVELAHQMGRPVRYGGEFGGFNERAQYLARIASEALEPLLIEDSDSFKRQIKRVPYGVVMVIFFFNYT